MRKYIVMAMLTGTFLWGYHLGRTPESPDIFAWASTGYQQAGYASQKVADVFDEAKDILGIDSHQYSQIPAKVGGKLAMVGQRIGEQRQRE